MIGILDLNLLVEHLRPALKLIYPHIKIVERYGTSVYPCFETSGVLTSNFEIGLERIDNGRVQVIQVGRDRLIPVETIYEDTCRKIQAAAKILDSNRSKQFCGV